jgi:hypothetical protein
LREPNFDLSLGRIANAYLLTSSQPLSPKTPFNRRVTIDGPVSVGIDGGHAKDATAMLRLLQRRE